jgi:hypothetical protein
MDTAAALEMSEIFGRTDTEVKKLPLGTPAKKIAETAVHTIEDGPSSRPLDRVAQFFLKCYSQAVDAAANLAHPDGVYSSHTPEEQRMIDRLTEYDQKLTWLIADSLSVPGQDQTSLKNFVSRVWGLNRSLAATGPRNEESSLGALSHRRSGILGQVAVIRSLQENGYIVEQGSPELDHHFGGDIVAYRTPEDQAAHRPCLVADVKAWKEPDPGKRGKVGVTGFDESRWSNGKKGEWDHLTGGTHPLHLVIHYPSVADSPDSYGDKVLGIPHPDKVKELKVQLDKKYQKHG